MKERGILFSAPMVRALLAGIKTQTRRAVKPQPDVVGTNAGAPVLAQFTPEDERLGRLGKAIRCPYGVAGDRLWVREAYRLCAEADATKPRDTDAAYRIWYESDAPHQPGFGKLRPGMFMPRWASRISMEVVDVWVERLADISEADCIAEGCPGGHGSIPNYPYNATPCEHYRHVWEAINGKGSWDASPWVWVVVFRRLP